MLKWHRFCSTSLNSNWSFYPTIFFFSRKWGTWKFVGLPISWCKVKELVAKLAAFQSVGQIGLYCWHYPLALLLFSSLSLSLLILILFLMCNFRWFPTFTLCWCFTYPPAALFSGVVFRTRMRKGRVSCYILQLFIKDPWLKVEVCQDRVSFVRWQRIHWN